MEIKLQKQSFIEEIKRNLLTKVKNEQVLRPKVIPLKSQFSQEFRSKIVVEGQANVHLIPIVCQREGISISTFNDWTKEFIGDTELIKNKTVANEKHLSKDQRFKIVLEGKGGYTSIAEICRREGISQDVFLEWNDEFLKVRESKSLNQERNADVYLRNKLLVDGKAGHGVFQYLKNYVEFRNERNLVLLKSSSAKLDNNRKIDNLVVLEKINDIRYINKFFEKVNSKLDSDAVFVGCLETYSARKIRKTKTRIPLVSNAYFFVEFLFKRILPKLSLTKKYYFNFTKGSDRLLSKGEGLGRLVSCGFKIMDYKTIDGLLYFIVKKEREPYFDMAPSYGPLYKMNRLGKDGKIIGVYKFRTMHPYSEYLQDYIVNAHGYAKTGKPADDFRIPAWGKFMRRFWLDELPQLINVVKGELKLVGVRPVSERYFQDIPKEMQKLRMTQKPGCVPPYVSLNRKGNVMSVLNAEKDYLEEKIKNPFFTDTKYFFSAIFNIIFRHKRSA